MASGLAMGQAYVYRDAQSTIPAVCDIERHEVDNELSRIEEATARVVHDLKVSARRIEKRVDAKLSAIFEAHEAMLMDPLLRGEIRQEIDCELVNAEHALNRVFRRWERKFREMSTEGLQLRADDLADLRRRLLLQMAGVNTTPLEMMPEGRVLVARQLLPSDTVALPRRSVVAIVVESGGPGSHAALLARAMGIPTVAQVERATERIADGDLLLVDGFAGDVVLRPDEDQQSDCQRRMGGLQQVGQQAMGRCRESARRPDGTEVAVYANVGSREDADAAAHFGADGIGLYRMEQYYLSRQTPPSAEELLAELREIGAPLKGRPLNVRLLDLGGDKPLPFLKLPPEDNAFLGRRGVRLLLKFPDLITTQFRALLSLSQDHDVRVLVPMVTLASEMAQVRERLVAVAREMGIDQLPPLGAMIELPAAALCVPDILRNAEFLGIGTNDLTQYTMAASRENPYVSDYYVDDHPAVLRLIRLVVEEGGGVPIEVCGELAGRPDAVAKLLGLGIRALSVAPPLIPQIKEIIRETEPGS